MTTLPRKRQKQQPMPDTFNLHQIEAWASMVGNEINYDQRRIIVTRKIAEYVPCPPSRPRSMASNPPRRSGRRCIVGCRNQWHHTVDASGTPIDRVLNYVGDREVASACSWWQCVGNGNLNPNTGFDLEHE